MNRHKWYPTLLLGLSLLLATSSLACSKPTQGEFATYENDTWGYAVSYPSDWTVEALDINTTEIRSPSPGFAHIEIYADEALGLPIKDEVASWLEGTMQAFGDVILQDGVGPKDSWVWYLSYDYFLPEYDMTFHGETYLKQTQEYLYRISLEAEKQNYSQYPFQEVVSMFTLVME